MKLIDGDLLKKKLERLWDMHDDYDFSNKDVWQEIENAPVIEPQPKWIPVTEALPEKHQRVLVTIKRSDGEMRARSGSYSDDYFWIDNGDYWKCNEVLAWMPLPEPYRGE